VPVTPITHISEESIQAATNQQVPPCQKLLSESFCPSFPHHWDLHLLNAMVEVTYNNITLNTNEHPLKIDGWKMIHLLLK